MLSVDALTLLATHFVESVEQGTQPISDVVSGLVNNTILGAIYESAASGKAVELDWGFLGE